MARGEGEEVILVSCVDGMADQHEQRFVYEGGCAKGAVGPHRPQLPARNTPQLIVGGLERDCLLAKEMAARLLMRPICSYCSYRFDKIAPVSAEMT
jgi:hypothetical protein